MVWNFIRGLGRQRVSGVMIGVKGKGYNAQAMAKAKVSGKFNKAVDGAGKKA